MAEFAKSQRVAEVPPLRILIADDSDAIRGILRRLIADGASECRICGEAVDGRDVIRKAAELRPDAILLDLSIPVVSGIEAAKVLQRECPAVDVIFMSAQEPSVLSRLAANAHVSASISKTLLARELMPLLHEISARRRAACAAA
ncbi:MAG TPA: response regulator transcription factor [Candidatus Acidoferrales bacterium]